MPGSLKWAAVQVARWQLLASLSQESTYAEAGAGVGTDIDVVQMGKEASGSGWDSDSTCQSKPYVLVCFASRNELVVARLSVCVCRMCVPCVCVVERGNKFD